MTETEWTNELLIAGTGWRLWRDVCRRAIDSAIGRTAMTEDTLRRLYTGSELPTVTGHWVVTVTAAQVAAEPLEYRLTCNIAHKHGLRSFRNVSVEVRAPESWPYTHVLQRLIQRIDAGDLSDGSTVMCGVPDTNPL